MQGHERGAARCTGYRTDEIEVLPLHQSVVARHCHGCLAHCMMFYTMLATRIVRVLWLLIFVVCRNFGV